MNEVNSYKEEIIKMVEKIDDLWILEVIHRFIKGMIKERS